MDELQFDEYNEAEMLRHGVTAREVRQVFELGFRILRNANDSNASHRLLGLTLGRRWLTIPVKETDLPGVWRPATAFPSSAGDIAKVKGKIS